MASHIDLNVARDGGLPPDLAAALEGVPGVAAALPVLTGTVFSMEDDAALTLLGIDLAHPRVEQAYAGILMNRTLGPAGVRNMTQDGSVLVPAPLARARKLHIGSQFIVQTATGATHLRVGGILELGGIGRVLEEGLIVTDLGLAERLLLRPGQVDRIDVMAADAVPLEDLTRALRQATPPGTTVAPPHEELAFRTELATAFIAITSGVSVFGLIVGFFLISNVFTAAVIAEGPELARLRLQGARRRDLLTLIAAQAAYQGIPGIVFGAALGIAMGVIARVPFLQGLGSLMQVRLKAGLGDVSWLSVVLVALLGFPTAIGASWFAVHRKIAATPLRLVATGSDPVVVRSGVQLAYRASLMLLGTCCVLLTIEIMNGSTIAGMVAIACVSALVATTAAALVLPAAGLVRPVLARTMGIAGELAADGLARAWSRTATTIGVFALGIGTATCTTTIFHSAEALVLDVLRHAFRGDVVITSAFREHGWLEAPLDVALAREVATVDGVSAVETERIRSITVGGLRVVLRAVEADLADTSRGSRWVFVDGTMADAARGLRSGRGLLVARNFAHRAGVHVGDSVELQGDHDRVPFRVVGIVEDFVSAEGSIIMLREQYGRLWRDELVNHIGVTIANGRDTADVISNIKARLGGKYVLRIVPTREFLAGARDLIGQVFQFTRGMTSVILLIATVALLQSIVSGALESRRLLSIFRALGASRRQLGKVFVLQGATVGLVGTTLGLLAGVLLSTIWVPIHIRYMLGWLLPLAWPWGAYLVVGFLALTWASLAGLVAARALVSVPSAAELAME